MSANLPSLEWRLDSCRRKSAAQQPVYPDQTALEAALRQLRQLPPLVNSWEVESLKEQLDEAALALAFSCKAAIAPKRSPIANRGSLRTS